ncbi:hypothetical protein pipiens_010156 [Culex pipiens pipiens]|uniref:AIP/AIPL N-terminal FKBP-type PPIase domain-containing protein n=1 Tax=Culex pipiens pipiens TaxID=38569 RepID=A0ABD1DB76_CULPP
MDPCVDDESKIVKRTLHAGTRAVPFRDGTRIRFHYQTRKLDGTVLDDSREQGKPMELVLGKKRRDTLHFPLIEIVTLMNQFLFACD